MTCILKSRWLTFIGQRNNFFGPRLELFLFDELHFFVDELVLLAMTCTILVDDLQQCEENISTSTYSFKREHFVVY